MSPHASPAHVPADVGAGVPAAVLVVSDRCSRGAAEDRSGPVAAARLRAAGFDVGAVTVVPDGADEVRAALTTILAGPDPVRVVVTSGGTGLTPRDRTPEGTLPLIATELLGLADAIRRAGEAHVATAVLSRGLAGLTATGQLVVNLPGSPAAVDEGLDVLLPLLPHLLDQVAGGDHA